MKQVKVHAYCKIILCVPTSAVRLTEKLKYASQFQLGDIEEKKNMLGH